MRNRAASGPRFRLARRRAALLLGALCAGAGVMLASLLTAAMPAGSQPASGSATTRTAFAGAFPAMAYYETSCARCHGPQGSFYGPQLGKDLADAKLTSIIREMAEGPGAAPLQQTQLAVVTAFHRALVAGEPFVSVTAIAPDRISGEVMPQAIVKLTLLPAAGAAAATISATVEGSVWSAVIPANMDPRNLVITAERADKRVTLSLREGPHSHAAPIK